MSTLFSLLGSVFITLGIIFVIWLVIQVEYTVKFSWFKTSATVTVMALLFGFGIHLVLASSYL